MKPSDLELATSEAAWSALEDPLTLRELRQLSHLQLKIAAAVFLADQGQSFTWPEVKRLAFARYLSLHRRITEFPS